MSHRLLTRGIFAAGVAATVAAVGSTSAVAATSDSSSAVASPWTQGIVAAGNGTAGIAQTVDVVAPRLANQSLQVVASNGAASDVMDVTLDSKGEGSVAWTPEASGAWTLGAAGAGLNLIFSKPVIAAVPTVTEVLLPNKTARFQPMGLIAVVKATEGKASVQGSVTFFDVERGKIGSVDVKTLPGERAIANLTWSPPGAATYAIYAKFTPAVETTGTPAVQSSFSPTRYLDVVEHPVAVELLMPPVMRIGHPVPVIAQLPEIYRGTVSLVVDGREVSPPKQTEGGLAFFEWTPAHTGLTYVQLELIGSHFAHHERLVTQTVDVQDVQVPNPISVTPVINGVAQAPWAAKSVLKYTGGTRITLVTSTGNGAGVNIEQSGACLISGSTLYTPIAGGGCRATFGAPGDAQYGSNKAELVITATAAGEVQSKAKNPSRRS